MQCFQTKNNLNCDLPNFVFGKYSILFLKLLDFLEQVPVIGIFHDDTEIWHFRRWERRAITCFFVLCAVVHESFIVSDNIVVVGYWGQNSHFVYWIFTFFVWKTLDDSHFLEWVYLAILFPDDFINSWVWPFTKHLDNFEVVKCCSL